MAEAAPAQDQEPNTDQQPEGAQEAPSFLESLYPQAEPDEGDAAEPDEGEGETTAQPESGSEPEGDQATGDEEGEVVTSLTQFIEQEGYDQEWFNNLKVPVKVDGEQTETTVGEMIASHQMREMAEKYLSEAKEVKKSQTKELHQERESLKAELGTAAALVQLAEQLFNQDISEANLAKLREEDPQAYLVQKDQFAERRRALDTVKAQMRQNLQQAFQEKARTPTDEDYAKAQAELVRLEPALAQAERRAELYQYAVEKAGYTPEDLKDNLDPRIYRDVFKAMLYDELQAKTHTAKKKVAKIPKVMPPGAAQQKAPEAPKDAASILYG